MLYLDGSFDAASLALAAFMREADAAVPEVTWLALGGFEPSPVDRVVRSAEALYAAMVAAPGFPAAGATLCAQLAQMAVAYQWNEFGLGRGNAMIAACRRYLGELTEVEAPIENDPAPLAAYLPS